MTWQATLKPYKHQINDLGRVVDIVICAENFFFCCDNSGVKNRENPDGRAQTYPTYPGMRSGQAKIIHTCVEEKADTKQEHNALSHMTSDPTTAIVGTTLSHLTLLLHSGHGDQISIYLSPVVAVEL